MKKSGELKKSQSGAAVVSRKKRSAKLMLRARGLTQTPSGFMVTEGNILIPASCQAAPVKVSNLRKGFEASRKEIKKFIQEIVDTMNQEYQISEIELTASFNADGKFLGFGVGGAASIKFTIKPK